MDPADEANQAMVDRSIAQESLWSPQLIEAFRTTPRHRFLDRVYVRTRGDEWREIVTQPPRPGDLPLIYSDRALTTRLGVPAGGGAAVAVSSSSQPSLMAQMLEDLRLEPALSVLEIGTGTGYNAALMAAVVGPGLVVSLDVDSEVLRDAEEHLRPFRDRRIQLVHADGRQPCPVKGPFDRLIVTAATPDLEPAWLDEIEDDGVLLAPIVMGPGLSFIICGSVKDGVFSGKLTRAAYFMPLREEGTTGTEEADGDEVDTTLDKVTLDKVTAPWAEWIGRRRGALSQRGLLMSLAFYGLLRGLSVGFRANGDWPLYGVTDRSACTCWFDAQEWQVTGDGGKRLGQDLWRAFLDAGAPWPNEFDVSMAPVNPELPAGREVYERQGPRCKQVWRLRERRERPAAF